MKKTLMLVLGLALLAAAPTAQANALLDPIVLKLCFEEDTTYTLQSAQIALFDAGIGKRGVQHRGRIHGQEKVSKFGAVSTGFRCTNIHFVPDGAPEIYYCPVTRAANTLTRGQCRPR